MGMKHLREDEKGSGLVLTLMVLLVLSVLGISIGTLTIGSYRLSDANRDDTSAYYVAEAGAVAAYEKIQKEVLSAYVNNATEGSFYNNVSTIVTSQNGQSAVDFGSQFGSKPSATIRTEKTAGTDPQVYTIYSTGNVDGKDRTVTKQITVEWFEKNTGGGGLPTLAANGALFTKEDIKISDGVTINGNIYTDDNVNIPNGNINGNIYANGGVTITDGMLKGDIYTNSTKKNAFTIGGWINLRSSTLFHSNQITAEEVLKYPKNYTNFPRLEAKDNVWDSSSYLSNFKAYQSLLDQVQVPTETNTDFKKLPDKTIQKDQWNQYKVQDNGNLFLNSWMLDTYNLEIQDNIFFNKLVVGSGKTLTIDPMGGNHTILVDDLSVMSGTLNIVGEGTVTMVVTGKMAFNHTTYINNPGSSNQLVLMYTGPTPNFNNITKMNAHVIVLGNKGPVNISDSTINGVFLTDNNNVNNTSNNSVGPSNMMLIAPNAAVSLSGSYSINGTVIAKTFKMDGGASLKYADVTTTGFPFGSTEVVADPDPEDIISSGTVIEN